MATPRTLDWLLRVSLVYVLCDHYFLVFMDTTVTLTNRLNSRSSDSMPRFANYCDCHGCIHATGSGDLMQDNDVAHDRDCHMPLLIS